MAAGGDLVGGDRHRDGVVGARSQHLDPGAVAAGRVDAEEVAVGVATEVLIQRPVVRALHRRVDHQDVR
jgi:hypothetical protein